MKGKTKSGFEYKLTKERLNNYELLEVIGDVDENPLLLPKVVVMLLGQEQTDRLKDHLRSKDGIVSVDALSAEIKELFEKAEVKN